MMTQSSVPSPPRVGLATAALALGTFVIGMTEFVTMGLLPEIGDAVGTTPAETGRIIATYAVGVVLGAPLIVGVATHLPRRALAVAMVLALGVGNLLTAMATSYEALHVTRFLAGLPHAVYFGTAQVLASSLVPAVRQGRAVAMVALGLTVSGVTGVPLATWLGQTTNWRVAFVLIFAVSLVAAVLILVFVPPVPGDRSLNPRSEWSALRRPQVVFGALGALLTASGIFAMYSYVSPLVTDAAGMPRSVVPVAMLLWGLGGVIGGLLAGRIIDAGLIRAVLGGNLVMVVLLIAVSLAVSVPALLLLAIFLVGLAGPPASLGFNVRIMREAGRAQLLGAALTSAAFNASNGLGALVGSWTVLSGLGYGSTGAVGAVITTTGLIVFGLGLLVARRTGRREAPVGELLSTEGP
ncbi:putative permease of the major facilitator superfamily protein [Aeromicrobium flavum]|uniref:Putative permease of the major facilitator superfamily protein n=1 Tax=Aeromicrobium flavum TaxID=416568 RepID=A0A512HVA5_9ACTN|nr:MFS transporter [Aeromicrobium flavum]GEO89382.1 putative permease of the major facilitator superfamily protein [Aeromicrobium flavum]